MKTTAIPTYIATSSRPNPLASDSLRGLLLRIGIVLLFQFAVLIAFITTAKLIGAAIAFSTVFLAFAVVQIGLIGGMVFAELPRGNDWTLARLYASTGIRSGFPILAAVVLDALILPNFLSENYFCLLTLYCVGLVTSIAVSIHRLDANPG